MNNTIEELFYLYKNLRSVQNIVNEILTMDYYVYNFDHDETVGLIDHFVKKYNKEIKLIASLRNDSVVVVDDDPNLYDEKDEVEINSDAKYIRDALIIIGAVKSGIRKDIQSAMEGIVFWQMENIWEI